jgi:hypothetical protein
MHPISDKELDKLFQQRFEEVEFQPSGDVWMKISAKMDQKGNVKKSFPVFWMAAASVVVVLGAGLWFYRPVEVIKLQGTGQQEMVQDVPAVPITDLGTGAAKLDPHEPEIKGFDFSKLALSEEKTFNTPAEVTLPSESVNEIVRQDLIASNNTPRRSSQEVSQPNKEVKVPRYTGDQSKLDVTQPDMIASAEITQDDLAPEHEQNAPKRIRSVGSLVNFVISKVDRRDDKIIEFKDGEEGSEVSGINLGLIKLKSRIK